MHNLVTLSADWEQSVAKPMGYLVADFEPRDHDDGYCLCLSRETADDHAAEQTQKALDAGEVHETWPVYPVYAGVPPEGDETPREPHDPLPTGCKNLPAARNTTLCPFGCLGEGRHSKYVYTWDCGSSCMRLVSGDVGAPIPGDLRQTTTYRLRRMLVIETRGRKQAEVDLADLRQQVRQFLTIPDREHREPPQLANFILLCDEASDNAWSRGNEELVAMLAGQFKPHEWERPCPPE